MVKIIESRTKPPRKKVVDSRFFGYTVRSLNVREISIQAGCVISVRIERRGRTEVFSVSNITRSGQYLRKQHRIIGQRLAEKVVDTKK